MASLLHDLEELAQALLASIRNLSQSDVNLGWKTHYEMLEAFLVRVQETFDEDDDGVVDDSSGLAGKYVNPEGREDGSTIVFDEDDDEYKHVSVGSFGDMQKVVYDENDDGVVDAADYATEAGNASTADTATVALDANHADAADEATHATAADSATHADDADHADASDEADHAASADRATDADSADSVDWADVRNRPVSADYFLHDDASDIPGAKKLLTDPAGGLETSAFADCDSGSGEVLIGEWLTDDTLNTTLLRGGAWHLMAYVFVDSAVGITQLVVRIYARSAGGVYSEIVNVESSEIDNLVVALQEIDVVSGDFICAADDRLAVRLLAKTTSAAVRRLTVEYEGTSHYTHLHTPYGFNDVSGDYMRYELYDPTRSGSVQEADHAADADSATHADTANSASYAAAAGEAATAEGTDDGLGHANTAEEIYDGLAEIGALQSFVADLGLTGWVAPALDTISWNDGTRTFTLTPGATAYFYIAGVQYEIHAPVDVDITDTEGAWYVYIDSSGVLHAEQVAPDPHLYALVSEIHWDVTNHRANAVTDNRHTIQMSVGARLADYNAHGIYWVTGLEVTPVTLGDGSLDVHAQVDVSDGTMQDADLQHDIEDAAVPDPYAFEQILATPAEIPLYYRLGASGRWRKILATHYPMTTAGTGRAAWNEWTGATWKLSECTDTYHLSAWILGTSNADEPIVAVVAQWQTSGRSGEIGTSEFQDLDLGVAERFPFPGAQLLARVVYETDDTFANAVKSRIVDVQDLRSTGVKIKSYSPPEIEPAISADNVGYDNAVSGLSATTVRGAIDELAASPGGSSFIATGGAYTAAQVLDVVVPYSSPAVQYCQGQFSFDASKYIGTFYVSLVGWVPGVTGGRTCRLRLYNLTDGEYVTNADVSTGTVTTPTSYTSAALTVGAAAGNLKNSSKVYEWRVDLVGGADLADAACVGAGRLLLIVP